MGAQLSKNHQKKLEEDPFKWINDSFRDWSTRQHLQSVLDEVPIDEVIADAVKTRLRTKVKKIIGAYDFHTFYPPVIISYSTGNRRRMDDESAGPGLLVVVCVINHLLNERYHCYSDILTPGGREWEEYMLRVPSAKVMIVLMTRTFFRSVHCLREVAKAIRNGLEIIPVRCEKRGVTGVDIARDRDGMWPFLELANYAQHQDNVMAVLGELRNQRNEAVERLTSINSIPSNGTLWSSESAVDELVARLGDFASTAVRDKPVGTDEALQAHFALLRGLLSKPFKGLRKWLNILANRRQQPAGTPYAHVPDLKNDQDDISNVPDLGLNQKQQQAVTTERAESNRTTVSGEERRQGQEESQDCCPRLQKGGWKPCLCLFCFAFSLVGVAIAMTVVFRSKGDRNPTNNPTRHPTQFPTPDPTGSAPPWLRSPPWEQLGKDLDEGTRILPMANFPRTHVLSLWDDQRIRLPILVPGMMLWCIVWMVGRRRWNIGIPQ